ncbi:MAG TPA: metalloregulator ArsR/SmtB family transcription factor [Oscillospiraceae bacterium]|nr:metalloregulator ArsR/SmtB family transcription factor [Oscillospiraceae bacterium]HPF55653.1 metalloregulator ArsR/SmtB family transcription factor [Clostridiales bacterium]HPK34729.1 metalloregulator ArsR/SmtB family transcription factor [Oscillospiraceae bacterium]HPR76061.1 metalloregulator ArsR/SmtB family transcription factor [Oscillospiraceae bacterium]
MSKNEFICDCNTVHGEVVAEVNKKMLDPAAFERLAGFFKVFGDVTRMKILWALDQNELCVCDLANILSMSKSAVSHQLAALRKADLVRFRKAGKEAYYSLADDHVKVITETGLEHINE